MELRDAQARVQGLRAALVQARTALSFHTEHGIGRYDERTIRELQRIDATLRDREEETHAIDGTIYPIGYPLILCTCGVSVIGTTWQDAGGAFDAHLKLAGS